jgi:hypothetical protein
VRRAVWSLVWLVNVTVVACADEGAMTTPFSAADVADCAIRPTFSSIHEDYIQPSCSFASCHAVDGFNGLDLGRSVAYRNLVGVESSRAPGVLRVAPGDPDASFLVHKIEGTHAPEQGDIMPPGSEPPAAGDCRVRRVRGWIERGAPND